ncbi:MAG: hypothetical protein ABIG89_00750 [Candidatus Woesearchaeota archaeon]
MSFLKQDINFNLLFLIGVVVTATVLLTLYFTHALGNVNVDYNHMEDELESISNNLTQTTLSLQLCKGKTQNLSLELNETKQIEEKSRDEYNQIYEQTEGELTKTQSVLKETKDSLDTATNDLKQMTFQYTAKSEALAAAEAEIGSLEKNLKKAEDKLDDVESCLNNNELEAMKNCMNNAID